MNDIADFFEQLPERLGKADLQGEEGVVLFSFEGDGGGYWSICLRDGNVETSEGVAGRPRVTITMAAEDFRAILAGKLGGQTAFLTGRLRVQGDMGFALRAQNLLKLG